MRTGWMPIALIAGAVLLAVDALSGALNLVGVLELGLAGGLLAGAALLVLAGGDRSLPDFAPPTKTAWSLPDFHGVDDGVVRLVPSDDATAPAEDLLPRRLLMLARGLGHSGTDGGCVVLLDGCARAAAGRLARATAAVSSVPVLHVRVDGLVSEDIGLAQRVLNTLLRRIGDRPCVLFLDGLDAVAQPGTTFPAHRARRVTNDVVSALRRAATVPGVLTLVASASVATLDRSVTSRGIDHVIAVTPPRSRPRRTDGRHTEAGAA